MNDKLDGRVNRSKGGEGREPSLAQATSLVVSPYTVTHDDTWRVSIATVETETNVFIHLGVRWIGTLEASDRKVTVEYSNGRDKGTG